MTTFQVRTSSSLLLYSNHFKLRPSWLLLPKHLNFVKRPDSATLLQLPFLWDSERWQDKAVYQVRVIQVEKYSVDLNEWESELLGN